MNGQKTFDVVVVIPTYNEHENIGALLESLNAAGVDVLVVDDNSPDGTGDIVATRSYSSPNLHLLRRAKKDGLGRAYIAGFTWALSRNYSIIVEMDADGSHRVDDLQQMIAAARRGRIAIGTRWMPGGAVQNWPWYRQWVSRGGTAYARLMLGSQLRDMTSGYRAFPRAAIEFLDFGSVSGEGYVFQIEVISRLEQAGFQIEEVPITFVERELGTSKMSCRIVLEALLRVTSWGAYRVCKIKAR